METISFKDTPLLKQGIWLSAAAMVAFVATPSILNGELWKHPVISLVPLCLLSALWAYFLLKMPIYRVVDQVMDCGDHLKVRRGRIEEAIPFSSISAAAVSTVFRMSQITVRLREPSAFGERFSFLPQASLWSNPLGVQLVASALTERAQRVRAKGG